MDQVSAAGIFSVRLNDFFELTKPRIGVLVLITTYAGMHIASPDIPSVELIFFTLLGTWFASAASGLLNNYVDRDIDPLMDRTKGRALASGRVSSSHVLFLALSLLVLSATVLFSFVNGLAASLALLTVFFYIAIYSLWLKRSSPLCTEVGGVAGALPPVIGWAAVTGEVGWQVIPLFLLLFLWQPPHFWALALLRKEEYRKAGLPMLPVISGDLVTQRRMLAYTLTLLPLCVLIYFLNIAGMPFLVVSLLANAVYLIKTIQFCYRPVTPEGAKRLFFLSIMYLSLVFVMLFVDG